MILIQETGCPHGIIDFIKDFINSKYHDLIIYIEMRLTFVLILFLMPAAVPAQKAGPELVASAGDFFENDGISLS